MEAVLRHLVLVIGLALDGELQEAAGLAAAYSGTSAPGHGGAGKRGRPRPGLGPPPEYPTQGPFPGFAYLTG